jgi:hypothetical protein
MTQHNPYGQPGYAAPPAPDPKAEKKARKAARPWYKKKRFILPLILLAIIIVASLAGGGGGDDTDPAPAAPQVSQAPDATQEAPAEEAVVVSAQQMIDELEGNALAAKNTYQDKRVTVTGKVSNIDASGDYFNLVGTDEFTISGIQVFIDESFADQVATFSTDQEVTVTGTVTDVGEIMGYSIDAEQIG